MLKQTLTNLKYWFRMRHIRFCWSQRCREQRKKHQQQESDKALTGSQL